MIILSYAFTESTKSKNTVLGYANLEAGGGSAIESMKTIHHEKWNTKRKNLTNFSDLRTDLYLFIGYFNADTKYNVKKALGEDKVLFNMNGLKGYLLDEKSSHASRKSICVVHFYRSKLYMPKSSDVNTFSYGANKKSKEQYTNTWNTCLKKHREMIHGPLPLLDVHNSEIIAQIWLNHAKWEENNNILEYLVGYVSKEGVCVNISHYFQFDREEFCQSSKWFQVLFNNLSAEFQPSSSISKKWTITEDTFCEPPYKCLKDHKHPNLCKCLENMIDMKT